MPLLPIEHRLQESEAGCLAACVQSVLSFYQIQQSQRQLNRILGLPSLGIPFSQITNVERIGVSVMLDMGEESAIQAQLDIGNPVIVPVLTNQLSYWGNEKTQHAITVIGYDERSVFINDPAFDTAPQTAGWLEFMLARDIYDYIYATITRPA